MSRTLAKDTLSNGVPPSQLNFEQHVISEQQEKKFKKCTSGDYQECFVAISNNLDTMGCNIYLPVNIGPTTFLLNL